MTQNDNPTLLHRARRCDRRAPAALAGVGARVRRRRASVSSPTPDSPRRSSPCLHLDVRGPARRRPARDASSRATNASSSSPSGSFFLLMIVQLGIVIGITASDRGSL